LFIGASGLVGSAVLEWMGYIRPERFWTTYLYTFRTMALLGTVFGLGGFFFVSTREQLRETTEKLQAEELAGERARKLAAEARLASLESRIQPHFLFNTLNSISALIPVDPQRAEEIVGRLATLLRFSLATAGSSLVPLSQELAIVEDYVDIEKARLGDKLRGRIEVPPELRAANVPPLSIQSLVENAVKHGIAPQRGGGEFVVSGSAADGLLRLEVADNGAGFDLTQVRAGHGLDNLVGRLDALFGANARLNVRRRDGWCVVEMVLPLK